MTNKEKYEGYSASRLFAEIGDKRKAMEIYVELYPEEDVESVEEMFNGEEEDRKLSVYEVYCIWGRMTDGIDEGDAIRKYMQMHPDANEADVRAELEKAIAEKDL